MRGAYSLELLERRVASIPAAIRAALRDDDPAEARRAFPQPATPLHIVGAGGSEGPARMLAACLEARGWRTRATPPSSFALDPPEGALAIVSQGMSPNARLVLHHSRGPTLVFTAADVDRGVVVRHGPAAENEMLVRVVGPVLASLAAVRFAGVAPEGALAELPERLAAARIDAPAAPCERIVFVAAGGYHRLAHGLRWKLLETLGMGDPPVYDILQFAHGPFQQHFDHRLLVLALDRGTLAEQPLFARLTDMLVPGRHQLVRLRATLPWPVCWFEHDALVNRLVLDLLRRTPRDLVDWPGKGRDTALYGLER